MPATESPSILEDFEAGRIEPEEFPHRAHVQISYELLGRYRFPEALLHLARGLRRLAAKAGKPEIYHETITAGFLALIAERLFAASYSDFGDFVERNPDLLRKQLLNDIYKPGRLQSQLARKTFILPRL